VKGEKNNLADGLSRWPIRQGVVKINFSTGHMMTKKKNGKVDRARKKGGRGPCAIFGGEPRKFCILNVSQVEVPSQPKALDFFSVQGSWRYSFLQKGYDYLIGLKKQCKHSRKYFALEILGRF
jgi:hypothetical protein